MLDLMDLLTTMLGLRAAASARNLAVYAGQGPDQWVMQASFATAADAAGVLGALPMCTVRNRQLYEAITLREHDLCGGGDDTAGADQLRRPTKVRVRADGSCVHLRPRSAADQRTDRE